MTPLAPEMLVKFDDPIAFEFAVAFLSGNAREFAGAQPVSESLAIEVAQPVLARLLQRLADGEPSVLLRPGSAEDYWMLVGGTHNQLERALADVSRFILPTYAEFQPGIRVPIRRQFDPTGLDLRRIGARVFPGGYYRWESPARYRGKILERIDLWLDLTARRPPARREPAPSYRDELRAFESELAAADWNEAEQTLDRIRRANLTSADNLDFLTIELLAQQHRWHDLWNHPDYDRISLMRMPRIVRAAMLTAFHATVLLPLMIEHRWVEALEAYRMARPRLGRLLATRADLREVPVLEVFAFEAAIANDGNAFAQIESMCDDPTSKRTLDALGDLNPVVRLAKQTAEPALAPLLRAQLAVFEGNYDEALAAADLLQAPAERALVLVEIAFRMHTPDIAERAVLAFWDLSQETQDALLNGQPVLQRQLDALLELTGPPDSNGAELPPIDDWIALLNEVSAEAVRPDLSDALDRLTDLMDERTWSNNDIVQLADRLLGLLDDPRALSRSIAPRTVDCLVDFFLRDDDFPRPASEYADLYEVLYTWLIERADGNELQTRKLIRLAEAILHHAPKRIDGVATDLIRWLDPPRAALEDQALDAFELLAEYGLPGSVLITPWRGWVTTLLHLLAPRNRASLSTWLALGEWIQPGSDILSDLRARLNVATEHESPNPIALLPPGYRIGIFTLRPGSADRVRSTLLGWNPQLDVHICTETDLSNHARALAESANMAVVVVTCITHALTYGIQPYFRAAPVFPNSSGSSSILRAIEDRARTSVA